MCKAKLSLCNGPVLWRSILPDLEKKEKEEHELYAVCEILSSNGQNFPDIIFIYLSVENSNVGLLSLTHSLYPTDYMISHGDGDMGEDKRGLPDLGKMWKSVK